MSDEIVPGMTVTRKKIFTQDINSLFWATDMLTALNTAKNMGFHRFEVELGELEEIEKTRYAPVGGESFLFDQKYEKTGTYKEKHQTITIYAVVVE